MRQVVENVPERPRALNPQVDRDLETICLKCLEKEPKHRYGSAEALAEDLERWLRGEPILARPSAPWERTIKWARRKPAIAVMTVAVLVIASTGLVGVLWQWQEAEAARKIAENRAVAEAQAKANEAQERRKAQNAFAQVADALARLEIQKAEELFREDKASMALAYLARVLRIRPTNWLRNELSKR